MPRFGHWRDGLPRLDELPPREHLVDHEIVELALLLRAGHTTAVELTQAYLDRIDRLNGPFETYDSNGGYNAFVRVDADEALRQARRADERLRADPAAPLLCGIPLGAKETIAIRGLESKNGTHLFDGNLSQKDATVISLLRQQGTVLLGHTIASELSSHTTGTFAGNAWDPRYIPGGSSQGSGVAPMARLAAAAIGVETGGSIVIPAACNGISAIKPTLGLVSEHGVMQNSPGLDVVGPMARSVRDASLLLSAMSRFDQGNNPATREPLPTYPLAPQFGDRPLAGVRIGIPQSDWMSGTAVPPGEWPPADTYAAEYRAAFQRFKEELRSLGAMIVEFDGLDLANPDNDPFSHELLQNIDGLQVTGAMANRGVNSRRLRCLEAIRAFAETRPDGNELIRRYAVDFLVPRFEQITFATYLGSEQRRHYLRDAYQRTLRLANIDFMMMLPLGAPVPTRFREDEPGYGPSHTNQRRFYAHPNLLGWPMVTLPIGLGTTPALPITAAFWGPSFSEPQLIQAAIDYQARFPEHHQRLPPDPVFGPETRRPAHNPRVAKLTAQNTSDPLALEWGDAIQS